MSTNGAVMNGGAPPTGPAEPIEEEYSGQIYVPPIGGAEVPGSVGWFAEGIAEYLIEQRFPESEVISPRPESSEVMGEVAGAIAAPIIEEAQDIARLLLIGTALAGGVILVGGSIAAVLLYKYG